MPPFALAKIFSFGTWFMSSLIAILGHWIWRGTRRASKRKDGEPPPTSDGGSFNPYRGR